MDFSLAEKDELAQFVEVKLSDDGVSRNLRYFKDRYPGVKAVQLVHNARNAQEVNGVSIMRAGEWLAQLSA